MRRGFLRLMILAGVLFSVLLVWRGRGSGDDSALVVGVSGNTLGYLEPCDCQVDQSGGLARRQTLSQQQKPDLWVDAGNVFGGTGAYERLKGEYLLRGMKRMGYAVINPGENEVALPEQTLSPLIRESGLAFVSCNVTTSGKGTRIIEPFRIETRGNLHVGITGVVDIGSSAVVGKGWTIKPPQEALAAILPTLRKQCDILLVLASASNETLTALAERFPEIDAIIGSAPDGIANQTKDNATTILTTGSKGNTVAWARFVRRQGDERFRTEAQTVIVAESLAPDPEIAALIRDFHTETRTRQLKPTTSEGMERIETRKSDPSSLKP